MSMSRVMLELGDEVEVVEHSNKKYIGRKAKVISIGHGIAPSIFVQRVSRPDTELRYDIELDDHQELYNLRETQIHKVN